MHIRHLFISTGHNYFGHHGQPAGEHPIREVEQVECVAGEGLRGDRFFGYRPDYKGQITFFEWEVFEALRKELGLPGVGARALRRNVITEGVALARLIGEEFSVQGVSFLGVEECRPCYWMDHALGRGAETWMKGRGGLRARIVTSGFLGCEDEALSRYHERGRALAPR
jgi:MOSC domain-containing protein YiiM